MPVIEWSDKFSIGIEQIDEHHRHLFSVLNTAYTDFINPVPTLNLNALFDELIDYAIYHFFFEEHSMQEHRYPGLSLHRQEHDLFTRRVVVMHEDHTMGRKLISLEVISFLYTWLSTHILQLDAEYGRFLAAAVKTPISRKNGKKTIA